MGCPPLPHPSPLLPTIIPTSPRGAPPRWSSRRGTAISHSGSGACSLVPWGKERSRANRDSAVLSRLIFNSQETRRPWPASASARRRISHVRTQPWPNPPYQAFRMQAAQAPCAFAHPRPSSSPVSCLRTPQSSVLCLNFSLSLRDWQHRTIFAGNLGSDENCTHEKNRDVGPYLTQKYPTLPLLAAFMSKARRCTIADLSQMRRGTNGDHLGLAEGGHH